ncbi:hypothetical protein HAX54_045251 [Datura stramonium]|uniref:Uncharacterized protein n=1 Tax=Datura stramonium TaxID=4076 RepID=A0ABS8RH65_DATST|nr:hypothetical protein [Datura stramonium]
MMVCCFILTWPEENDDFRDPLLHRKNADLVLEKLRRGDVSADIIGQVTSSPIVELKVDGVTHLNLREPLCSGYVGRD